MRKLYSDTFTMTLHSKISDLLTNTSNGLSLVLATAPFPPPQDRKPFPLFD